MSKEVILKIKEAEAEAARIRAEAAQEAKARIHHAEQMGAVFCERMEQEATAENAEKLRLTAKKAEEHLARTAEEAQAESDALLTAGEPYLADAVRMIIGGIFEKCQ